MDDCISRKAVIAEIMGQPPDAHYPSWYAEQIKNLPAADVCPACWTPVTERLPELPDKDYCYVTVIAAIDGHDKAKTMYYERKTNWRNGRREERPNEIRQKTPRLMGRSGYFRRVDIGMEDLKAIPDADVVEVVRCRECNRFRRLDPPIGQYVGKCIMHPVAATRLWLKQDDGFCAWAQKKGAENEGCLYQTGGGA